MNMLLVVSNCKVFWCKSKSVTQHINLWVWKWGIRQQEGLMSYMTGRQLARLKTPWTKECSYSTICLFIYIPNGELFYSYFHHTGINYLSHLVTASTAIARSLSTTLAIAFTVARPTSPARSLTVSIPMSRTGPGTCSTTLSTT